MHAPGRHTCTEAVAQDVTRMDLVELHVSLGDPGVDLGSLHLFLGGLENGLHRPVCIL